MNTVIVKLITEGKLFTAIVEFENKAIAVAESHASFEDAVYDALTDAKLQWVAGSKKANFRNGEHVLLSFWKEERPEDYLTRKSFF